MKKQPRTCRLILSDEDGTVLEMWFVAGYPITNPEDLGLDETGCPYEIEELSNHLELSMLAHEIRKRVQQHELDLKGKEG